MYAGVASDLQQAAKTSASLNGCFLRGKDQRDRLRDFRIVWLIRSLGQ